MIDPMKVEIFSLPLGGGVHPLGPKLEEIRVLLVRRMKELDEIAASLEAVERLPQLLEHVQALVPVLQARTHAGAAAEALRKLLAP